MASSSAKWTVDAAGEAAIVATLQEMEGDEAFNTEPRYHTNGEKYPGNLITFSQLHLEYLKKFPAIDPSKYILNLKLMTRLR